MSNVAMWIVLIVLVVVTGLVIYSMMVDGKVTSDELDAFRKWLVYAVTVAENTFGAKMGPIKLHWVYDLALERFPWIASAITVEQFDAYVDEAIIKMYELACDNDKILKFIDGVEEILNDGE